MFSGGCCLAPPHVRYQLHPASAVNRPALAQDGPLKSTSLDLAVPAVRPGAVW